MKLETIAGIYGMIDYLEPSTGRVYQLSKARKKSNNILCVPVIQDGMLIGYAKMKGKNK